MHVGRSNPKYDYQLNNNTLEETVLEKDLGIYVTPDWKPNAHVAKVAAKANSMIGRINRTFSYMDVDMFKAIYPSMIRSHMEYAVQAWSPQTAREINLLEQVQRRATRLVGSLRNSSYETRKEILGLTPLHVRRTRGDLIEVFKIMHGLVNVERDQFFKLESNVHDHDLRRHNMSIWKPPANSTKRRNYFDHRVIETWNKLPENLVNSLSIREFKQGLDAHLVREEASV